MPLLLIKSAHGHDNLFILNILVMIVNMVFLNDVKKAWRILFSPAREASVRFGVFRALKFYYEATLLPVLLTLVLGYFSIATGQVYQNSAFVPLMQPLLYFCPPGWALVISTVVFIWIALPAGFFINALFYQIVGKDFLKVFRGSYERTFSALAFSALPYATFTWLFFLPFVNSIAFVVLPIWTLVLLVIALAVQQRASRLQVIGTIFTLALFVFMLFALAISMVSRLGVLPQLYGYGVWH